MNIMVYRLMILLIALVAIVSCSTLSNTQSNSRVNLEQLDLTWVHVKEKTALMRAAEQGNSTALRNALQQGDLLNAITPEGTAFSLALSNGHEKISKILLAAGSNWRQGFDSSALIYAAEQGFNAVVKILIVRGADIDYTDKKGYSAVAKTAINGHLTTLKIMINAGANVDVTPEGRSLLMHVVDDNNMLLSQLIIAAGANVNFQDEDGETALRLARKKGYFDLDLMLVQAGARP